MKPSRKIEDREASKSVGHALAGLTNGRAYNTVAPRSDDVNRQRSVL
jgi:hypothetical protein